MENKKVLAKLVKIASNQQEVLNRLAQAVADESVGVDAVADKAMSDFIKYHYVSWSLSHGVVAHESHSLERPVGTNHYDVDLNLALNDKAQQTTVVDPTDGFASFLTKKFVTASKDPRWKALDGFTASFKVNAN
jgi:hypothetical protein